VLRFITNSELMSMHGLHDYNFQGLTMTEQMGLVGRGMNAATLVALLVPALKALGFYVLGK
jgi:hypothetical protein